MNRKQFVLTYEAIIKSACSLLKPDRFAVIVVGEYRDKHEDGVVVGFVQETIEAFRKAGCSYYNDAVLVTMVGSLPLRVGRQFVKGRKLGRTHQYVLIFCKGDAYKAAAACHSDAVARAMLTNDSEQKQTI